MKIKLLWSDCRTKKDAYEKGRAAGEVELRDTIRIIEHRHKDEIARQKSCDDRNEALNKALTAAAQAVDAISHAVREIAGRQ